MIQTKKRKADDHFGKTIGYNMCPFTAYFQGYYYHYYFLCRYVAVIISILLITVYTRLQVEKFWTIFKTLSGGFDLYSGQRKNAMPESNIDVVDESVL